MGVVDDDLTLLRSAKCKCLLICFVNRVGIILANKFEKHLQCDSLFFRPRIFQSTVQDSPYVQIQPVRPSLSVARLGLNQFPGCLSGNP